MAPERSRRPGGRRPRRGDPRARTGAGESHGNVVAGSRLFSGAFVQRDGLGGAVRGVGGGIVIGSRLRARKGDVGGRSRGPCTPVCLSIHGGRGGAVSGIAGLEHTGSINLGHGGDEGTRVVSIGNEVPVPCQAWEEPTGIAARCEKPEKIQRIRAVQGETARQERGRPRNSSGSLTS
jgi:hypothetical protein